LDLVSTSPARGDVFLVALDPTRGSEIAKTRPCAVVSPDELNAHLRTVTVVPMTTSERRYRFRVDVSFAGKEGVLALDQIRTIDKSRLVKRVGTLDRGTQRRLGLSLAEYFAW
jgi:mRNA interferase MazF